MSLHAECHIRAFMLSVTYEPFMLNVIMLSVVMLVVVAPVKILSFHISWDLYYKASTEALYLQVRLGY